MPMKSIALLLSLTATAEAAFPGRIEAENWNAFHDNASSPGTQACTDAGGGLNVGWIDAGEWLAYDINVTNAGDYRLAVRAASASGGVKLLHLEIDDVDVSGPIAMPFTDGWQTWHTLGFAPVPLTAGPHRVKVVFDTGNLNLNWIDLSPYVPVAPKAPDRFVLKSADTTAATFEWLDGFDDETGFQLFVSTGTDKPATPTLSVAAGSTTATVTGLTPGQPHHAWLEAVNAAGNGTAATSRFTTLTTALPPAIAAGAGSYAAYPPYLESSTPGMFQNYALNPSLSLAPGDNRPVPTNDWWSHMLENRFGSSLWSYPHITRTQNDGFRVQFPRTFNPSGSQIQTGASINVSGNAFIPVGTIAKDWSDWGLVASMQGDGKSIDATIAHGVPFTFFEFQGTTPEIRFSAARTITLANGSPATFPSTASMLRVEMDGGFFGLHFPDGTTVSESGGVLSGSSPFLTVSVLPAASALAEFHAVAFNIPRESQVTWDFDPAASTLHTEWTLTTENPTGAPAGDTLQGFLPHHTASGATKDFEFTGHSYTTTRGPMTLAKGKSFGFTYRWSGILPHYPVPTDLTGTAPWRPEVMNEIISDYAANASYGTDTYWGGKGLVNLGKYLLFARDLNHPAYPAIKAKLKQALADWLTYTPGESSRFYAAYPRWGALVGFDESYYSYQFTDHHFHYGYLIHAAALMAMDEPEWVQPYAPMLQRIAKEYANWDRDDASFPFLRTFDPWIGHSYAGGTGSPGGNNQESTSEAVQSWAGLFFLGQLLGDDAMRDAGAFGYQAETNATMEYWFNRPGTNWPAAYKATHDVVGILWNDGFAYGTFFSGAPHHIYGIQWLPVCPAFKHVAQGVTPQWSTALYQGLLDRMLTDHAGKPEAADGVVTEPEVGNDWANVLLGYRLFSDPGYVTGKLEQWRTSAVSAESNTVFSDVGGLTYWYSHAHQSWGDIDWEVTMSLPASTAFRHPVTGQMTYVAFNPSATEQTCDVRRNGSVVGSFRVPALKTVAHHLDAALTTLQVTAPKAHLVLNESVPFTVTGYDQYGATWDLGSVSFATTPGGVISADGVFTAFAKTNQVTVTATSGVISGSFTFRIGDPLKLASLAIAPEHLRVPVNGSVSLTATGLDQYGSPFPAGALAWSSDAGTIDAAGNFTAPASPTLATIQANVGGQTATALASVHAPLQNLAIGKPATTSNSRGTNTAPKAFDGNPSTRWETAHGVDNQWIAVDLGAVYDLTKVVLKWETAAAASYTIDVSNDGVSWNTVHTENQGNAGTDEIPLAVAARHVRMSGITRTTVYGFSLWEFEVFGHPNISTLVPTSLHLLPGHRQVSPGGTIPFKAYAFNASGAGSMIDPLWSTDAGTINSSGFFTAVNPGTAHVGASFQALNATVPVVIVAPPSANYEAWRSSSFSAADAANALISGPDADPDGDGLSNLVEFYLVLDPTSASGNEVTVTRSGNEVAIRFTRDLSAAAEVSLKVESSSDLNEWDNAVPLRLDRTPAGPDAEQVVAYLPASNARGYYRLAFLAD
jgi:endoglucanase Acf2